MMLTFPSDAAPKPAFSHIANQQVSSQAGRASLRAGANRVYGRILRPTSRRSGGAL